MAKNVADPTWCYDNAGEATLHYLAPDEKPPTGLSRTPPKGTHPHERELAEIPRETAADPVTRGPGRPPSVPLGPADPRYESEAAQIARNPWPSPQPDKRGPGRPPTVRSGDD
jgi:hypothetical protein